MNYLKNICKILIVASTLLFAQETTVKLPTTDNTSSFNITKSNDDRIFKLNADGGFYLSGYIGVGVIPKTGSGTRLMFYPKKAAFRAGYASSTQWDDANIGNYSTAIGGSPIASGDYSTAFGVGTTSSGNYSTTMGYLTTASGQGSTAFGVLTTASGHYSIAMGHKVSTNSYSGCLAIGDYANGSTLNAYANNMMIARFIGGYTFYTNTTLNAGVTVPSGGNAWASASDSTKKENVLLADGEYFLNSISKLRLGSWNYKGQDAKIFRHYGPMAQEIFHYFGKDKHGTIGCDTLLATADMDGIMMIALQALENRSKTLDARCETLEKEKEELDNKYQVLSNETKELRIENEVLQLTTNDLRLTNEKRDTRCETLETRNSQLETRFAKLEEMMNKLITNNEKPVFVQKNELRRGKKIEVAQVSSKEDYAVTGTK